MPAFKRILVPTDFSEASKAALKYARELAEGAKASLTILHVFEPCPVHRNGEGCSLPPDFLERAERQARGDLANLLSTEEKRRSNPTCLLLSGPVAQVVLSYLNEHREIDLVVMATHGRGGVARLMLGSVADKIVRAAPCPVVTIRASEATMAEAGPEA